jgi:uncharacterized protein YbaP (TraB family)
MNSVFTHKRTAMRVAGDVAKLKWLFSILLLCLPLIVHAERGILWKVQQPDKNKASHILGTIHSDDPAVTRLPPRVVQVFSGAKSFTAELDLDISTMLQAQLRTMLPADQRLQDMLGQRRYQQSIKLLAQHGVPEILAMQMKPWAIAAQLSMPKPSSGLFLDLQLYQQAVERGLPTYGLESIDEQFNTFERLTLKQQIAFLDDAIARHKDLAKTIESLITLYLQRDLDGMLAFSDSELARGNQSVGEVFKKDLIDKRNRTMVLRMQPRLSEGDAFIAVGALHLPAKNGILNLLRQQGYHVEAVY